MSLKIKYLLYNKNFDIKDEEIIWATFKHQTNIEGSNDQINKLLGICETTIELSTEIDEHSKINVLETQENIISISSQYKDVRFCLVFKTDSVDMTYKNFKKEFVDKFSRLIFNVYYKFYAKKHENCESLFGNFVQFLDKMIEFNMENPFAVFNAVVEGVPVISSPQETLDVLDNYLKYHLDSFLTDQRIVSLRLFHKDVFIYSYKHILPSRSSFDEGMMSDSNDFCEQEEETRASSVYSNNNTRLDPYFDKVSFLFYMHCLISNENATIHYNKNFGFIMNIRASGFCWHIVTTKKPTPHAIKQIQTQLDFKAIDELKTNNDFISDVVMTEKMAAILNINFYKKYIGDISFKKYLNFIFRKNYFIDSKLEEEIILYNEQTKNGLICKYIGTIDKYLVVYIHKVEEEDVKKHRLDSLRILFCS